METEEVEIQCPYCGEVINVQLDPSAGTKQDLISDCDVCCRPIELHVKVDDEGLVHVRARRESETFSE